MMHTVHWSLWKCFIYSALFEVRITRNCSSSLWLPVSCSPLQRKASTSWRFWFPAMRRVPSSGREVKPSSSCRKRPEPPSNCQNPKTSTLVSRPQCCLGGWMVWETKTSHVSHVFICFCCKKLALMFLQLALHQKLTKSAYMLPDQKKLFYET